ncbi:MAG: hypothetical protein WAV41_04215 [Microgenomates group bacterium]
MAEFRRSRIEKKSEDEITKKTVFLGLTTIVVFVLLLVFGLPLLIKFSIVLGNLKKNTDQGNRILPPTAPRILVSYEATNSAPIAIGGIAERNVVVELLKNDVSVGRVNTNDNGEFVFSDVPLDQGESVFSAVAISEKGGSGDASKEIKIIFDNKAPEIAMLNPVEETLKVSSADFDVIGQGESGVSVIVNGRMAMVDDLGKFKIKLQLNPGKNDVEIIVKDMAGNESKKKIVLTYDI